MCRFAVLISLALLVCTAPAFATEQIREEIVVEGRFQKVEKAPLLPWLAGRRATPWPTDRMSTACYRGYVGTWLLENDRLFLLSLRRMAAKGWVQVPLARHFGKTHPVPATWYTGEMALPLGGPVRNGRGLHGAVHPKTLYVEVVGGRVRSKRVVENRVQGALTRSYSDLEWVAQAETAPRDDGRWHDARRIKTEAFRKQVPEGTAFRTRGYFMGGIDPSLHIPDAPAVQGVSIDLENVPKFEYHRYASPAVEMTATWRRADTGAVLNVSAIRKLKPGETIHHPAFPLPADAEAKARRALTKGAYGIDSKSARDALYGSAGRLEGTLEGGEHASVLGVDVAPAKDLTGKPVQAVGILERWIVTKHLLATNAAVARWVGTRGPGQYFRLVDPLTGELVRPQSR